MTEPQPPQPPEQPEAPQPSSDRQRLSPRTLLVHPVRQLGSFMVPLIAVLFVGGAFDQQRVITLPLILVIMIAVSLARWATFTYRVGSDHLDIVHGVLNRQTRSIPLDRIRGVDITASPLHRLLDIAVVRIDAAAGGETKQEGELDAVSAAEAQRLRTVLLRRAPHARDMARGGMSHQEAGTPEEETAQRYGSGESGGNVDSEGRYVAPRPHGMPQPAAPGPVTLARLRPRWYLYAPLTAYLFVPLGVLGAAAGFLLELGERAGVLSEHNARQAFEAGAGMPYLLAAAGAVLIVVAMPVVAIGAFALANWDFTLRSQDGSLVGERGLLSRRSVALERARVRGFELREGLAQRMAGAAALRALVTGVGDVANRAELLPVAPRAEAMATAGRAVGRFDAPLLRHPPAARTRRLFRAVAPWLAGAVAAELAGFRWLGLALAVLALLGVPLGLDRYRSLGHAFDGTRLSVRSGSLIRRQVVIERRAVVGWTMRQTWLQRRVGLVTLVAGVGAGDGGYPAVDVSADEAGEFAAEVSPSWVAGVLVREE